MDDYGVEMLCTRTSLAGLLSITAQLSALEAQQEEQRTYIEVRLWFLSPPFGPVAATRRQPGEHRFPRLVGTGEWSPDRQNTSRVCHRRDHLSIGHLKDRTPPEGSP